MLKPENPEESSIVIFGAGAVGMAAVFGAAFAKIKTIIVVDIVDNRLELAKTLGATHSINGKTGTHCHLNKVIETKLIRGLYFVQMSSSRSRSSPMEDATTWLKLLVLRLVSKLVGRWVTVYSFRRVWHLTVLSSSEFGSFREDGSIR